MYSVEYKTNIEYFSQKGKKYSVFGFSGHLLSTLYCGTIDNAVQVLLQILSLGVIRAIMVGVQLSFHKIVRDGLKEKEEMKNVKNKSQ